MEKVHKIVFASLVVILLGVIIFVGVITNNKRTENVKNIVETVLSSNENVMLYLSSGKCTHCKYQAEEMSNLLSRYKFKYYYVDIDEVSNTSTKNDILTKLGLDIYNGVTFPALLVYNNGELTNELSDVQGIDSIYDFNTIYICKGDNVLKIFSDADNEVVTQAVMEAVDNNDLDSLVGHTFTNQDEVRMVPDILQSGDNFFSCCGITPSVIDWYTL